MRDDRNIGRLHVTHDHEAVKSKGVVFNVFLLLNARAEPLEALSLFTRTTNCAATSACAMGAAWYARKETKKFATTSTSAPGFS